MYFGTGPSVLSTAFSDMLDVNLSSKQNDSFTSVVSSVHGTFRAECDKLSTPCTMIRKAFSINKIGLLCLCQTAIVARRELRVAADKLPADLSQIRGQIADEKVCSEELVSQLHAELNRVNLSSSTAQAEFVDVNNIFADVRASDTSTAEPAQVYFEGTDDRATTLRFIEEKLTAMKVELALTIVRVNAASIVEDIAETVKRGVVHETVRVFSHTFVRLNSSFMARFGEDMEPAVKRLRQKCGVSISQHGVATKATFTWIVVPSRDAGPNGASAK